MILIITLAIAFFLWPQLGIHRLQVVEKERLLDEANQRLLSLIDELHRRLDEGRLEEIGDLNTAIASLEMELNLIKGTATWPWEPEAVRLLVTAVALPLGLWLIQIILERVLGA